MAVPNTNTCAFPGCDRPRCGLKAICRAHQKQHLKGQELKPLRPQPTRIPVETRFWAKVDKGGPTPAHVEASGSCWLWTAAKNARGYGHFNDGTRIVHAHRFAWALSNGPIPPGLEIDHICFTTSCVRPSHLRLATRKQNRDYQNGAQSNNRSSGVRGVYRSRKKWLAHVQHNGQSYAVGKFATVEEAAEAAAAKRAELFDRPGW